MLTRLALAAVVALIGCRRDASTTPSPPPATGGGGPPAEAGQLARGEYVAMISGCVLCHTPMSAGETDRARLFAGGLEEELPGGGVWRSPNITPDRETGIGAWTDAQIIAAIRIGVRPDGGRLLPIMPYPYYHRMTDADARAVVAFLRAQRPIANEVARSRGIPMRPVELPEPMNNVDRVDDPIAHGEYLASLMHCGACHTPQEGPHARALFAGGVRFALPGGRTIIAPNITSDPETGIGRWSEDQIIQTIRTMKTPRGEVIEGPMALYAEAWSRLGEQDARALAAYVKLIPPVRNEGPQSPRAAR